VATSSSFAAPRPKRAKVLIPKPKPCPLEKTSAVFDTEKMEIIEHAEAIPLAPETTPAAIVEASADPAEEHPKLLSPPTITELPKLPSAATTTMTPKKRRMASVLDYVLKSMKMPTPATAEASDDKIEDVREVAAASASSIHVEVGPLGAKPIELVEESLPEKPTSPIPEAPSQGDLDYIVRHASGNNYQKSKLPKCNIMLRT
jgi:hypothetical protein